MEDPTSTIPCLDECRLLILKIIEQSIRDYLSLGQSSIPIEQYYYETACGFLFDDDYYIDYGGIDRNLTDLLDILDIDIQWLREKVVKKKNERIKDQRKRRSSFIDEEET